MVLVTGWLWLRVDKFAVDANDTVVVGAACSCRHVRHDGGSRAVAAAVDIKTVVAAAAVVFAVHVLCVSSRQYLSPCALVFLSLHI